MRRALYNLAVALYGAGIALVSPFHAKAKKWLKGRISWQANLKMARKEGESWIWFHCASLGEFEQGRNLMEAIRKKYPGHKILLTFFSPSGYEIRKDYKGADFVSYLPLDKPSNVAAFLDLLQPKAVFFIKYEIWVNYLLELRRRKIPAFLVSSLVRPGSRFLGGIFGRLFKEAFLSFEIIFTQNDETKKLLENFSGHKRILVSGDTRFDRVVDIKNNFSPLPVVEQFVSKEFCVVCGSTWPEDEAILLDFILQSKNLPVKWIIAPHEIHKEKISAWVRKHPEEMISYSQLEKLPAPQSITIGPNPLSSLRLLWIDNIGMLSRLYHYSDFAFVGGAFGKLVHNTLEPAVFGNPVVFGPNFKGSDETIEMIQLGTAFSIRNIAEFREIFEKLHGDKTSLENLRKKNRDYVGKKAGATSEILIQTEKFLQ